jgi:hypothetical protein
MNTHPPTVLSSLVITRPRSIPLTTHPHSPHQLTITTTHSMCAAHERHRCLFAHHSLIFTCYNPACLPTTHMHSPPPTTHHRPPTHPCHYMRSTHSPLHTYPPLQHSTQVLESFPPDECSAPNNNWYECCGGSQLSIPTCGKK